MGPVNKNPKKKEKTFWVFEYAKVAFVKKIASAREKKEQKLITL